MNILTQNIIKSNSLSQVVMPLVRVMSDADLSWADREKLSAAIQACHRQWAEMEKERHLLNQSAGQQVGSHASEQSPQLGYPVQKP